MNRFYKSDIQISSNKKVAYNTFLLTFKNEALSKNILPGQFFQFAIKEKPMRRPLSIFSVKESAINILYRISGDGTRLLSLEKPGNTINILGPFGNSFPIEGEVPLFISGGLGIAPLNFLAGKFKSNGIFIYGTKSENEAVNINYLNTAEHQFIRISEEKDNINVCEIMADYISKSDIVYASGPRAMLKKVAQISRTHGVRGFLTWEERMGCGFGLCQSCAVKTASGYKMTCSDGPVFTLDDINWDEY